MREIEGINARFEERVIIHSSQITWQDSPMPGVSRRPLDRVGSEIARATSVVRYAPGSYFSPHSHTGGEEFLVLQGIFQDEHGDYPVGSYIRNPPGSSHTPRSESGCVIFVKLWQFEPDDQTVVRLNYHQLQQQLNPSRQRGSLIKLFNNEIETVRIEYWQANTHFDLQLPRGAEFFVLAGGFVADNDSLGVQSWLRMPCDSKLQAKVGPDGAVVWVKCGHLANVETQISRLPESL
jgi:quercetin dioxygenase-like cupin family protein